jgi:circadian clock protein KaiB
MDGGSLCTLSLRLYIAGGAPNSVVALSRLRTLLEEHSIAAQIEIVDVFQEPERAFQDSVIVTPTLIRLAPPPERRVVGDFADRSSIERALGIPFG